MLGIRIYALVGAENVAPALCMVDGSSEAQLSHISYHVLIYGYASEVSCGHIEA